MDFPDFLPLKTLETQHPDYMAIAPTLTRIDDLAAGGHQLEAKKRQYLKPRTGEEQELYELRLQKFTYTNVLGGAIAQQASKLSSSSLSVTGLESHDKFWQKFRENNNRKGRSEKQLLTETFRDALKFKRVYLHVEKPYLEVSPRTKQEEEALGASPYICLYTPLHVTNWGEGDTTALDWIKIRQVTTVTSPFAKPALKATWTFITGTHTAKYEAFVKLGKGGAIAELVNQKGDTLETGEDAKVSLLRAVPHRAGKLPVVMMEVPDDLWVTNQAYLKALEHLRLENSRSDTAEMVGYVQRTWKPHVVADTDLDHTFVDTEEELKTGNQYVIKGDFSFSEAQGTSLASVGGVLQEIRDVIQDMIGMARASATKGAVEQSGISKKLDYVVQELILKSYGSLVCDAYQDLLQLVAIVAGHRKEEAETISVTGLDSFDVDSLETMLAIAIEITQIEDHLPITVLKLFYQQLSNLLVKNASAEQQAQIAEEIEQLFDRSALLKDAVEAVKMKQIQQAGDDPLPAAA
ncbi:hypothetical protein IQ268_08945 [Oculatella sp. LEGE 06141]|uniref:hypothetical protein n=1 Tax=Oculatella sp. LEGE 06141 TaxID=1828648 RepID=UPI0018813E4B|nr:hypothetical protein [Oculatella sp. LEGE 06141]MBE9178685.1 hypothetical protein [Oculatella sp. LEGE 06141]